MVKRTVPEMERMLPDMTSEQVTESIEQLIGVIATADAEKDTRSAEGCRAMVAKLKQRQSILHGAQPTRVISPPEPVAPAPAQPVPEAHAVPPDETAEEQRLTLEALQGHTAAALKAMCRNLGIEPSGTKETLAQRILAYHESGVVPPSPADA